MKKCTNGQWVHAVNLGIVIQSYHTYIYIYSYLVSIVRHNGMDLMRKSYSVVMSQHSLSKLHDNSGPLVYLVLFTGVNVQQMHLPTYKDTCQPQTSPSGVSQI